MAGKEPKAKDISCISLVINCIFESASKERENTGTGKKREMLCRLSSFSKRRLNFACLQG